MASIGSPAPDVYDFL